MKGNIIFLCLVYFVFMSCIKCKQKNSWEYKIHFPTDETFINLDKKTSNAMLKNAPMKIVVYADSTGCTGCKLQLDVWKYYIDEVLSVSKGKVLFLFYLQPRNVEELDFLLESEEFNYPVCVDIQGHFAKVNHLNGDGVFLLDKNDKIVLKGHPLESAEMKKKYFEKISHYVMIE